MRLLLLNEICGMSPISSAVVGGRRRFCKVALVRFAGRLFIVIPWSMPTFQEQTRPFVTQSG